MWYEVKVFIEIDGEKTERGVEPIPSPNDFSINYDDEYNCLSLKSENQKFDVGKRGFICEINKINK